MEFYKIGSKKVYKTFDLIEGDVSLDQQLDESRWSGGPGFEEIAELIKAVEEKKNQVHEAADVLYHLMVLLEANGIKIEDVMDELKKRQK